MGKKIVIINTGPFPDGDAGAVRLRYMGRALVEAGYDVEVLCRGNINETGFADGIYYTSFRKTNGARILRGIDYYLFPCRVKQYLRSHKDISCVYIYYAQNSLFEFCKGFCNKHKIRLVHDCVEWYSADEFKTGEKSKAYIENNILNSKIIDQSFHVIAISRFLEKYFAGKGIPTLRIPILCDGQQRTEPKKCREQLTLFYAGQPLLKDYVGNLLRAALLLTDEDRKNLRIIFVGMKKEYLINQSNIPCEILDACEDFLELHGRMPRTQVLEMMEEADFTVLPRDATRRYAMAGFPSKVVESLANATPILCNYSSDLELYLHDGENAVIAVDHSPEELAKALQRALALSPEQKSEMSKKALDSAAEYFDFRQYVTKLAEFLEQ